MYLSTDQQTIGDAFDRFLGDWYWPTFWGNSWWMGDLTTTVPLDMPPGIYWVGARVSINGHQSDNYTPNNATFLEDPLFVVCDGQVSLSSQSNSVLKGGWTRRSHSASGTVSVEDIQHWRLAVVERLVREARHRTNDDFVQR